MVASAARVIEVKEPQLIVTSRDIDREIVVLHGSLDDPLSSCMFMAPKGTNTIGKCYKVTIEEVTNE